MSESSDQLVRVGITQGDFNGIGYEVIMKTFADHGMLELCTPVVYGIHKVASHYRKMLGIQDFNFYGIPDASKAVKHHCNFVNLSDLDVGMDTGMSTPAAGSWAVKSIQRAMQDLEAGLIDVIVTAPLVSAINNLDILLVCNDMPFWPPSLKILVPVVPPK